MRINIDRLEVVIPSANQQAQALHTAKSLRRELERSADSPGRREANKEESK